MRPRPRRALRTPLTVRVARIAVPAVAAGAMITTVGMTAWSNQPSVTAVPATHPSAGAEDSSTPARDQQLRTSSRSGAGRPSLGSTIAPDPASSAEERDAARELRTHNTKDEDRSAKAGAGKKSDPGPDKKSAEASAQRDEDDLTTIGTRYASTALNLRTQASSDAKVLTVLDAGTKLRVTKTVRNGFRLVVGDGNGRWVSEKYLAKTKPKPETAAGISTAACKSGSAAESGLTKDAVRVHRALCARFPQISSFGGARGGGGFHGSGQALDCMISDSTIGWQIARWVRANARRLGVSEVIYSQQIWTVQRSGEGWRGMADRGSATANHYDHVHVSVYGNAGTG